MSAAGEPMDLARTARWLRDQAVDVKGALRCRLITGGRSNLTYELTDEHGRRLVLRSPPRSADAARSHDIAREHGILSALGSSTVPVPRMEALCTDDAVIGVPFYVADFVEGIVLGSRQDGADLAVEARAEASRSIVDALAAVHAVDLVVVGLDELGPGSGYLERQLRRWGRHATTSDAAAAPLLIEVHDMLASHSPLDRPACLVHGDYKFPNLILDERSGAVRTVLDWELATLGDPLADLGNLLAMWPEPGEAPLVDSPTSNPGFLTREAVVKRYADQTGTDVSQVGWYHAFALWKIACLLDGVVRRYRGGAMAADDFDVEAGDALIGDLATASAAMLR